MPQTSNLQVLLFSNSDTCKVVYNSDHDVTIVWLTRDSAQNLADHIDQYIDEFPEVLPGG